MPTFNLPSPQNITNPGEAVVYINDITAFNGQPIIGPLFLLGIFFLFFLSMRRAKNDMEVSVCSSLWITAFISIFMTMIPEAISGEMVLGLIMLAGFSTLLLFRNG